MSSANIFPDKYFPYIKRTFAYRTTTTTKNETFYGIIFHVRNQE